MIKYYMSVLYKSRKNRLIQVFVHTRDGSFIRIGSKTVQTDGYVGDRGVANAILHEKFGYRWKPNFENYELLRKDIRLIYLPPSD